MTEQNPYQPPRIASSESLRIIEEVPERRRSSISDRAVFVVATIGLTVLMIATVKIYAIYVRSDYFN